MSSAIVYFYYMFIRENNVQLSLPVVVKAVVSVSFSIKIYAMRGFLQQSTLLVFGEIGCITIGGCLRPVTGISIIV